LGQNFKQNNLGSKLKKIYLKGQNFEKKYILVNNLRGKKIKKKNILGSK
jgi:hypothetical protein